MRENIVVCKIGGSIIDGVNPTIVSDIKSLLSNGSKLVLVHGGGDQVTDMAEKLGKKQKFISSPEGIKSRYTDKETAEIFTMVMSGLLAKQIVQILEKNGIDGVSLTGIDGALLKGHRKKRLLVIDERGRKVAIEGGFTGKISEVNTSLINLLISGGFVPVVSPGAGLTPVDTISVEPSGMPVGETGEPFAAMPSGEVVPTVGVGLTMALTCAIATLQTKSAARTAAVSDNLTGKRARMELLRRI